MTIYYRCSRLTAAAILVALAYAHTGPASAQDASLNLVPDKAPIVVQVNGFEKARNRLGKFLGNALPDMAPRLAKQMDDGIKTLAEGRDLKAIAKDGRIYLVIPDLSSIGENTPVAVLIPVTGYADFKKDFLKAGERKSLKNEEGGYDSISIEEKDDPLFLVDRKEYVVATNDKALAKKFAKADYAGLGKALSRETAKAFLDQDISVYVDIKAINQQYGAQIKSFKLLLGPLLQQGGMGIDKKQAEMVKQMFDSFISLLEDGEATIIGAEFRPEGFNFKLLAQFGGDTETNAFLKKLKPAALAEIGTLPSGLLSYTASNFNPFMSKTLSALLKDTTADDENDDAKSAIEEAQKELAGNGRTVELNAANVPMVSLEVSEYKDGAKAVASLNKMFKAMTKTASLSGIPLKNKPEIKENAETYGDYKLTMVKLSFDFDKAVEKLPEATREATKSTMMKLVGENTTVWFGHSGKKVIQVSTKDWKDAKTILDEYFQAKSPLEKDDSFSATRKQLPDEASVIVVGDTSRMLQMMFDLVKDQLAAIPGFPGGNLPELKAPKGKPAYFGLALVMKSEYAGFDLFVPTTAVQQVRKMLSPLIDMDN